MMKVILVWKMQKHSPNMDGDDDGEYYSHDRLISNVENLEKISFTNKSILFNKTNLLDY